MSVKIIGQEIRKLQNELEINCEKTTIDDIAKLRDNIIQLKRDIDACSSELTRYDLEHYSKNIMRLLKIIQEKEKDMKSSTDGTKSKKKFQFIRKSKGTALKSKSIMTAVNSLTSKTVDEKIIISNNVTILQNLENCQVSTILPENEPKNNNSCLTKRSGSITLSQVNRSRINLTTIPFNNGNIFITDCMYTTILVAVPPNDTIQLRLHNLSDCKISIYINQPCTPTREKQTVIIENIKDCIFDQKSEAMVDLQNFSHINGDSDDIHDYMFADIDRNSIDI